MNYLKNSHLHTAATSLDTAPPTTHSLKTRLGHPIFRQKETPRRLEPGHLLVSLCKPTNKVHERSKRVLRSRLTMHRIDQRECQRRMQLSLQQIRQKLIEHRYISTRTDLFNNSRRYVDIGRVPSFNFFHRQRPAIETL